MRHYILSAFILITITSIFLIAKDKNPAYNSDDSKIALQGYSPVSYLDLGIAQRGVKAFKSTYDGLNYYFTSAEQQAAFDANPAKYLPQYGGFCSFGVYAGAKFRVDPNKFVVTGGKLYLFLYDLEVDAQQLWLAGEHSELVAMADKNWKQLKQRH